VSSVGRTAARRLARQFVVAGAAAFVVQIGTYTVAAAPVAERDPLLWPYPKKSIWNHPRGDAAVLVPFPVSAPDATLTTEEDLIVIAPGAPRRRIVATSAGWNPALSRCEEATSKVLARRVPIPSGWTTDPGYTGTTPNHSAAIVLPNHTLFETQPLHVCESGKVVSQEAPRAWRGNSVLTGGTRGNLGGGAHGGSGMTAFGGTIRLGEWVPGGRIPHAVKITLDARLLSPLHKGFRWPAHNADAYFDERYRGDLVAARMGALLTVPAQFDTDALRTEPARILAEAIRRYGAYVVDDAGWGAVGIAVEWGPQGRVKTEFERVWGFPITGRVDDASGRQRRFLKGMTRIYSTLHVVDDNRPRSIGGSGNRMAPFAPPLRRSR
jgi:hypothetical protein